ncbi:CehA/McbA family metallohydrolase [Pseudoduganella sp. LjRoot289]|uniref:CehA/McbA family metallohydrolase n=1 Tax=Pseudoduganella sp. LjRoot289 TaxID=3342314 RepID=UPI003ECD593E
MHIYSGPSVMVLVGGLVWIGPCAAAQREHAEFEAVLEPPASLAGGRASPGADAGAAMAAETIKLHFTLPRDMGNRVAWRLELRNPAGLTVRRWRGAATTRLAPDVAANASAGASGVASASVTCCAPQRPGRMAAPLTSGVYQLRLRAEAGTGRAHDVILQTWDVPVGTPPALALPQFRPLATLRRAAATPEPGAVPRAPLAEATDGLPYTVYYGNLHSQSSHSDGGGALNDCHGAQEPQSAPFGPEDAFDYARRHGLDFLMTSEHNHMYDGSEGTNAAADPAQAKALYHGGLSAAAAYTAAHPDFLALYGMEWGVISNGGHLNILNSGELLGWERNTGGALLADTATAKGDYGALYTLMRGRGWIGQFNHPKAGQFRAAGKPLGYTEDGDAAMALCEVMNSNAFSINTTETEGRRSNYEETCKRMLEAGYHLAFASNQDNHCANWGMSYTNRTAVLIPDSAALSSASFLDAIRARRVFATMDKQAQIVFTANGHLMGERFSNSGPLTLEVRHANAAGKQVAALAIMEGVPGRAGSAAALPGAAASTTITPAPGEHFYYARITQDDGTLLWSAPVWVTQQ